MLTGFPGPGFSKQFNPFLKISNLDNFMKKYTTAHMFKHRVYLVLPFKTMIDLNWSTNSK